VERGVEESFRELCDIYRADVETVSRLDPDSPARQLLTRVIEDIERLLGASAPEWIPIGTIEARTGWSRKTLRRRFLELAKEQVPGTEIPLARRAPRWELHRFALERIRRKPRPSADSNDLRSIDELATRLGSEKASDE